MRRRLRDGWSDSKIMKAFDTTDTMVYTVRKKLVEEGTGMRR